jgi:hypothetical protein
VHAAHATAGAAGTRDRIAVLERLAIDRLIALFRAEITADRRIAYAVTVLAALITIAYGGV